MRTGYELQEAPAVYRILYEGVTVYVGSTRNVARRVYYHFWKLARGNHKSGALQEFYNGKTALGFSYEVLEYLPELKLRGRERYWTGVYVSTLLSSMPLGQKWRGETLRKKSEVAKRQMEDPEQYRLLSERNRINSERLRKSKRGLSEDEEDSMQGISLRSGGKKFRVRLTLVPNNPRVDLGTYSSLEEAQAVVKSALEKRT